MTLNNLDLEYVKKYLNVDHDLDDARLKSHLDTAKNYIAVSHGYESPQDLELNDYLTDLALIIVQDLYDNGTITQQQPVSFLTIDRRF